MIGDEFLGVWHGNQRVGLLRRRRFQGMEFQYEYAWVHGDGFALSQSMPLDPAELTVANDRAHRFFANLLPEGGARARIVRRNRVPDDDFELLRALGGDCAGSLSIMLGGQDPDACGQHVYEPVDDGKLGEILFQRGWEFADIPENPAPRLSLAGAQDKATVKLCNRTIYLPTGNAPSSHILKFDSQEYSNVLAFECFATLLAQAAGLPVVEFELRSLGLDTFALVKRYDRLRGDDGRILKLHQEDFCQALGYSSRMKYESEGGPSFARCFGLVRDVSDAPLDDLDSLLRWQIFNVLVGNSDGHAKNL